MSGAQNRHVTARGVSELRVRHAGALPEIRAGDDLPGLLARAAAEAGVAPGDVLVVAHKVVSKAEGMVVNLAQVDPSRAAEDLAVETGKEPALCELILRESQRIVARRAGTLICETHHGFVCANAAIDHSNTASGTAVLLPRDPDASAKRIQRALAGSAGGHVGVIISDTHGRAFRRGLVNIAVGVAGFSSVISHRGERDREGRLLRATDQAIADELAAVGGMLMAKGGRRPAVLVSGVQLEVAPGSMTELLREPEHDLFRAAGAESAAHWRGPR
jgi:coenzyme F420-0:L-glutamate ligase/coenzyme F420-1:gamma-L-glutamate ligase